MHSVRVSPSVSAYGGCASIAPSYTSRTCVKGGWELGTSEPRVAGWARQQGAPRCGDAWRPEGRGELVWAPAGEPWGRAEQRRPCTHGPDAQLPCHWRCLPCRCQRTRRPGRCRCHTAPAARSLAPSSLPGRRSAGQGGSRACTVREQAVTTAASGVPRQRGASNYACRPS